MRGYLRQMGAIVGKDLMIEVRTRERISAMAVFTVLIATLFNFAFDPTAVRIEEIAPGLLWLTILFGGMLGLGRTFALEDRDGALLGILQSPVPRDAVFLAKVTSNFLLVLTVAILTLVTLSLFFGVPHGGRPFLLVGVLALGVLGFVAVGTLFSAMTLRTTMGEALLPLLVFPLFAPVVIYGVVATDRLMKGRPFAEVQGNVKILGAFALVALAAGAGLFRFTVEE